jgi:hypothetical protein
VLSKPFSDDAYDITDYKSPYEFFRNLSKEVFELEQEYDRCCGYLYRIIDKTNPNNNVIKYSGYQEDAAVLFKRLYRCFHESIRNKDEINENAKQLEVLAERYYEPMPYNPNKNSIF